MTNEEFLRDFQPIFDTIVAEETDGLDRCPKGWIAPDKIRVTDGAVRVRISEMVATGAGKPINRLQAEISCLLGNPCLWDCVKLETRRAVRQMTRTRFGDDKLLSGL